MFDFDATKLIVIGLIALLVIGPKELPGVLRQVGQYIAKMRRMAGEFQQQFSDAMRESELQDLKKDMQKMAEDAKVDLNYDMVRETEKEIRDAVDNAGKPTETASALEAKNAPKNPTPDNDPDGAFIQIEIPKPGDSLIVADAVHAPVREVGLEPAPAPPHAPAKAREA